MKLRILHLGVVITGLAISGCSSCTPSSAPSADRTGSKWIRGDVLYLHDTPDGHAVGKELEGYGFRQEIIYRDLEDSRRGAVRPLRAPDMSFLGPPSAGVTNGVAKVVVVFDERGRVAEAAVAECSHEAFRAAALRIVKQWRVAPETYDGVPIRVVGRETFHFDYTEYYRHRFGQ